MSIFKKILLNIILITCYLLLIATKADAAEEFTSAYDITYRVNTDASVIVDHKISLTNKLANIYVSQYQISLGTTRIRNIWIKQGEDFLTPRVEKKENTTSILVEFTNKIVGKDKTLNFTLGYISDDYAMRNGRVLEIGIPKIAKNAELNDYKAKLIVPTIFESPVFVLPEPSNYTDNNNEHIYYFKKENILDKSITAAFGNFQIFDFQIKYHLENNNIDPLIYEIALPPDSPYQKLSYDLIKPSPINVKVDPDGNWLASYLIQPKEKMDIIASGSAEIYMIPNTQLLPQELLNPQDYLTPKKFWESSSANIRNLAKELKNINDIYKYVVKNLIYDYGRVNEKPQRLGALQALNNKESAICMEFTDLFITLARAAGIPAREVNGFAYTNNPKLRPLSLKQDVLHAWPQYYDNVKKMWISVDPTWENTTTDIDFFNKLDLNHFAFVFHGLDSEMPLVAGSYKYDSQDTKDVLISFGIKPQEKIKIKVNFDLPKKVFAGIPIKGKITITNLSNVALYDQQAIFRLPDLPVEPNIYPIQILPPYANYEQNVVIPNKNILLDKIQALEIDINNQKFTQDVIINSPLPNIIRQVILKFDLIIKKLFKK